MVLGSRSLAPLYTRVHYLWHKIGNKTITNLFNVLFNKTFTDLYTCYVMFRRGLVTADELSTTGWEQQAEILCLGVSRSKTRYDVPIAYHSRTYEHRQNIPARPALVVLWSML